MWNSGSLLQYLTDQLVPVDPNSISIGNPLDKGTWTVDLLSGFTQQDQANLTAALAAIDVTRSYGPRPLYLILADLTALSAAQKTNIATDLFTGSPMKVLTDAGPNAAGIFDLEWAVQTGGITTADKNLAKQYAAAFYLQDNPVYLVKPGFDPTINICGRGQI